MYETGETGLAPHLSIGRVLEVNVNTFTAAVYIISGRNSGSTPECIISSPSKNVKFRSGIIFIPEKDDEVYLDWSFGPTPTICGSYSDVVNTEKTGGEVQKITPLKSFGSEDKFLGRMGRKPYRWGPIDLMPGDKIIMGKLGNFIGILSGGISIIRGGPLSQMIFSKYRGVVKLISRRFELFSDFGVMRFFSRKGATGFEILGNGSAKKSNAVGGAWDFIFRLGGTGGLLNIQLMKDKFQLHINDDGHTTIKTAASFTVDMASAPEINIIGDSTVATDGSKEEYFTGSHDIVIDGESKKRVGKENNTCTGASNKTVSGPVVRNYMGSFRETVRGTSITDVTTVGYSTRVAAGDYEITIGSPLDFGTPSIPLLASLQTGGYKVNVFSGDFVFDVGIKGDFKASTVLGNIDLSTKLGDVILSTELGNIDISTKTGDVEFSTLVGNVGLTTKAGDAVLGTDLGNVNIYATTGSIKLSAGTAAIELGPTGVKITNLGVDLLAEIFDLLQNLATDATPGYGGPLTNVPKYIAQSIKIKTISGG